MTAKLRKLAGGSWAFFCPGCREMHRFGPRWSFDGDVARPTVSPSILVDGFINEAPVRCHSFIRGGRIEFLSDCAHKLAGQTVELPEVSP